MKSPEARVPALDAQEPVYVLIVDVPASAADLATVKSRTSPPPGNPRSAAKEVTCSRKKRVRKKENLET